MANHPETGEIEPGLSVIISTYNALDTVDNCLLSLRRQVTSQPFEVILVDSSADGTAERVRQRYPEVILLTSCQRLYCGDARNCAIRVACAPVIAFMDADCYVEEGWVAAVLEAHRSAHWLIGGAIHNGSPRGLVAWAYYFCEFNLWLPRRRPAEISEIAGCCLSLKREAFEKYGPFLSGTYSSDSAFQWRARRDGHRVLASPNIRVFHTCQASLREFLAHVAEHRRFFIRVARSQNQIARWQNWALLALSPVYPFLLFALVTGRVVRRPRHLARYLLASPFVFLGCCARAWGEVTGLVPGKPHSDSIIPATPMR